jgi:osmotically-inducible protein OsmY
MSLDHQIRTALEQSPHLHGRQLRFEAHEGHVTLKGVVRSYYQKQMAQETLRELAGVERIENQLEVTW